MANLFVTYKDGAFSEFDTGDHVVVTVGRELDNSLVLTDPHASRHHFSITREPQGFVLRNLSQTHGTIINSERIEKADLKHGDMIEAGSTRIRFSLRSDEQPTEIPDSHIETPASISETIFLSTDKTDPSNLLATSDVTKATLTAALESVITETTTESLRKRFVLLQDIGQQMVSQLRLSDLLAFVLDKIFEVLNADNGAILLAGSEPDDLAPMAIRRAKSAKGSQDRLHISRTLIQLAFREHVGILSADTQSDERFREQESIMAFGIRSVMCVPLIYQGNILGAIHVDSETAGKIFTPQDLNLLTIMANQAALCVHNARLHDRIVQEETARSNLERYFPPQVVERLSSHEIHEPDGSVEVTVLYSDIRDFTPLSERVSPEELLAFLNQYFSEMLDIVFEFGGTLDKFIGDALLAVFGSPIAHSDDTLNAARCAEKMIRRLSETVFPVGEISVGIGLHRGPVIHGDVGSQKKRVVQYTVIGDTVNTTARLCSIAAPNQVVLSSEIARALQGRIECKSLGLVELKGKTEPLETFELVRCL